MYAPKPPSAPKPPGASKVTTGTSPTTSYITPTKLVDDADEEEKLGFVQKIKSSVKKRLDVPKAHTRIMVCALAVSLLWASSLVVCRLVVYSFMPRPTLGE